jgi:hypothetical protein
VGGAPSVGGSYGGLEYCRRAFVVQSGQNLSFAAGEFITIGFHSNGGSNTFYASPTTAATNKATMLSAPRTHTGPRLI